ncbi:Prenylcysteine oxidase-like [Sparganum proliferum]
MYVKSNLTVREITAKISDDTEAIWLNIKARGSQSLEVVPFYLPPQADPEPDNCILESIKEIASRPDVVLMGDFNAPCIQWNDIHAKCSKNAFDYRLLKTTLEALLTQRVLFPTRARGGQQASYLDLVFTKDPDSIDEVYYLPPLGRRNHAVLLWEYELYSEPYTKDEDSPLSGGIMADSKTSREPTRVGIVGGGLCGCSTAYFLRKLMGPNVSITLFERSGRLGGRIKGEKVGDKLYETGGTIFLSSHKYINSFVNEFDNPRINRKEQRRALVARELARYKVYIAALSEPRFSEQGQLEDRSSEDALPGDVATGKSRPALQGYSEDLPEEPVINPVNWEYLALDRPIGQGTVKIGAAIYEITRVTAAKAKHEARKSQLRPTLNANDRPPSTCSRCQRTFLLLLLLLLLFILPPLPQHLLRRLLCPSPLHTILTYQQASTSPPSASAMRTWSISVPIAIASPPHAVAWSVT